MNASLDANSAIWDNLGFDQRVADPCVTASHRLRGHDVELHGVGAFSTGFQNSRLWLIESGAGWVPFWLEAMEHQLDEFRTAENRGLKLRPKEYFKQQFLGQLLVRDLRADQDAR